MIALNKCIGSAIANHKGEANKFIALLRSQTPSDVPDYSHLMSLLQSLKHAAPFEAETETTSLAEVMTELSSHIGTLVDQFNSSEQMHMPELYKSFVQLSHLEQVDPIQPDLGIREIISKALVSFSALIDQGLQSAQQLFDQVAHALDKQVELSALSEVHGEIT